MLFGSVNALKNIMLSGLFLMVLSVFVPATNAQTASNSQQSQLSQQSANASQRAEIFAALVSLNEKYKKIAQRIPIEPLLKDPSKRFDNGEELIFSIIVSNLKLAELFGYKANNGMRLGFAEFTQALDLQIEANADNSQYTGWFIKESNTFSLAIQQDEDLPTKVTVTVKGEELVLAQADYQIEFDGIYIDTAIMARWFGIEVEYDFVTLSILLLPSESLPIQARLQRKSRKINDNNSRKIVRNPLKDNDYQALSPQTLDVVVNASVTEKNNTFGYSVLGARDLAYMKSEFYALGNNNEALLDARVKFSRSSTDSQLLNGVATQIQAGDISPIRVGVSSPSQLSRGISLTNRPLSGSEDINMTSFKGDIQNGWDVELYRNNILVDSIYDVTNGRYDFDDVALFYGNNVFVLVFYGPQGQIRKEKIERLVDQTIQQGQGIYSFSINQLEHTVFNVKDSASQQDNGFLAATSFEKGITDTLSIRTGFSSQFAGEQTINTAELGFNSKVFERVLLASTVELNDNNRQRLSANLRTNIDSHAISSSINWTKLDDPISGQTLTNTLLSADVNGNINIENMPNISYQQSLRATKDQFGNTAAQWITNLATNIWRTSFNAGLVLGKRHSIQDGDTQERTASLNVQRLIGPVFMNLQSVYDLDSLALQSISTQLNMDISENVKSRLTYQYSVQENQDAVNLDINWRNDDFSLSSNYSYSDVLGWSAGLFFRFGMGYISDSQHFIVDRTSLAAKGSLLATIFLDNNYNGVFDDGDDRIPGVQVEAVQAYQKGISDVAGLAVISGIPDNKITDIKIQRDSLPDPYMITSQAAFSIRGRSGYIEMVDIPIVYSSEIDGTIFIEDKFGIEQQVAYAPIHLSDRHGDIIKTVESEFDGYYLFMDILPGEYQITIDDDYLTAKNIETPKPILVTLQPNGQLSSGNNFRLAQVTYLERYIVSIGQFVNKEVMQAFWAMLQDTNHPALTNLQPFYVTHTDKSTEIPSAQHHLGIQIFVQKNLALEACTQLTQAGIECDVLDYEYASTHHHTGETENDI